MSSLAIGMLNPTAFARYQVHVQQVFSRTKTDDDNMEKLLEATQQFLIKEHNEEFVRAILDVEARNWVKFYISDFIKEQREYRFTMELHEVIATIQTEIVECGVLQPVLDDPEISSIEIRGIHQVVVERNGFKEHAKDICFTDIDHIYRIISKLLLPTGKTLTANEPVIDANYRGFRINVTLDTQRGGSAIGSPLVSIRKFPPDVFSDADCIRYGNMSQEISEFFADVIPRKLSVVICGGTNSGKTSQLIRFPAYYPPLTSFFTIEDSEEMMLNSKRVYQDYPNIASVVEKKHEDPAKAFTIAKLVKVSLRQNPDVVMIGEIRDEAAALAALQASNTGHITMSSLHSSGAQEGAARLMQLAGNNSLAAAQVAMSFPLFVYQRYEEEIGKRVVFEVAELIGFENGETPTMNTIFKYDPPTGEFRRVGSLKRGTQILRESRAPEAVIRRWCEAEVESA